MFGRQFDGSGLKSSCRVWFICRGSADAVCWLSAQARTHASSTCRSSSSSAFRSHCAAPAPPAPSFGARPLVSNPLGWCDLTSALLQLRDESWSALGLVQTHGTAIVERRFSADIAAGANSHDPGVQ